jgi:hypothetical protein
MTYSNHFTLADNCIAHLKGVVPGIADPGLRSQYVGFASVVAVTVFELAIKEILIDFAQNKHKIFGAFVEGHFERLNGRIKLKDLRSEHIPRFGDKYVKKFDALLDAEEQRILLSLRRSMKSSYGNLITWRHEFAHQGRVPMNATYAEVCDSYSLGKVLINCLSKAMVR